MKKLLFLKSVQWPALPENSFKSKLVILSFWAFSNTFWPFLCISVPKPLADCLVSTREEKNNSKKVKQF
jgi:hypothetical protein